MKNSDEIDIGIIFNAIVNLIRKLFSSVKSIIMFFYSSLISTLKTVFENYKIILPALLIASIIGGVKNHLTSDIYSSKMLVRTYYNTKYQVVNNINYYNTLIASNKIDKLNEIFPISKEDLQSLKRFEIKAGLESKNEQLKYYNEYLSKIDSSIASIISFEDFIKNRNLLSSNLFEICLYSSKEDVFKNLEVGLKRSFVNQFANNERIKRDSIMGIQKQNILTQIDEINKLKTTYLSVLEEDVKSTNVKMNFGDFPLTKEKTQTKEFELLNKEIELRDKLCDLEAQKVKYNDFIEILSSFQETGSIHATLNTNYMLFYPLCCFIGLIILYVFIRFVKYVNSYGE